MTNKHNMHCIHKKKGEGKEAEEEEEKEGGSKVGKEGGWEGYSNSRSLL